MERRIRVHRFLKLSRFSPIPGTCTVYGELSQVERKSTASVAPLFPLYPVSCMLSCVYYIVRVVNRKPKKSFFSVGFSRFFPTESRLFKVGFSVAQKNRNRKTDWVCWVVFFPHVPYANNAYISVLKPRLYGQSSSPRRQQHAAEQQSTGITFFYIPGTGSGIMASYPLRGFYRI